MKVNAPKTLQFRIRKVSILGTDDLSTIVEIQIPFTDESHLWFAKNKGKIVEIGGGQYRIVPEGDAGMDSMFAGQETVKEDGTTGFEEPTGEPSEPGSGKDELGESEE